VTRTLPILASLFLASLVRAGVTSRLTYPPDMGTVTATVTNETAVDSIWGVVITLPDIEPVSAPTNWQATYLDTPHTLMWWSMVVGGMPRGSDIGPGQSAEFTFSVPTSACIFPVDLYYTNGTVESLIDPIEVPEPGTLALMTGLGMILTRRQSLWKEQ
jgi:hypothetical protein